MKQEQTLTITWEKGQKKEIENIPLKGKVTFTTVNQALDKAGKTRRGTGWLLYHYNPVVTDEKIHGYCWKCHQRFTPNRIYGSMFGEEYQCPNCESKKVVVSCELHKCDCGGAFWKKSHRKLGPECVLIIYKCDKCGKIDEDVMD